jgi:hypothetical protein
VKVTSREKTFIMIGIAAVAAVLVFYAVITLMPDTAGLSQNVELKKRMLRNQLETLSREESYKARLDQYRKQLDQDMKHLLPEENPARAGADRQNTLKEFADQTGVEITQRNTLPEKKVYSFVTKVSVRIDTNCTPEQLVQFLSLIESYEKMLKVDELSILSLQISKKYLIRPSLTISGFIRSPEEKPKEKTAGGSTASNVS